MHFKPGFNWTHTHLSKKTKHECYAEVSKSRHMTELFSFEWTIPLLDILSRNSSRVTLEQYLKFVTSVFLATKEYVYLDGLLTSYILELDKITTDGYEEVRIARKSAIQSIQIVLNYLECKGG